MRKIICMPLFILVCSGSLCGAEKKLNSLDAPEKRKNAKAATFTAEDKKNKVNGTTMDQLENILTTKKETKKASQKWLTKVILLNLFFPWSGNTYFIWKDSHYFYPFPHLNRLGSVFAASSLRVGEALLIYFGVDAFLDGGVSNGEAWGFISGALAILVVDLYLGIGYPMQYLKKRGLSFVPRVLPDFKGQQITGVELGLDLKYNF